MEEEEHNPQKPSTRVEWFTTKVEKRETERARNKEHKADRKQQNKEVVEWLTQEANKNAGETRQEEEYLTKTGLRKKLERQGSERWKKRRTMSSMIKNCKETDTDPIETAETWMLIYTKKPKTKQKSK